MEPAAGTVVVLEDDPSIATLVDLYLRRAGYRVLLAADGEVGLDLIAGEHPRLVILDLGLAGPIDGLEVCRRLRQHSQVPIVMVTARTDEVDRIVGLELGADDYVSKPFSPRELVARVRAVLRRAEAVPPPPTVLEAGGLVLDPGRREVTVDGRTVDLATREFDLLEYLVRHPGLVLSRRQLLDGAWGPGWFGDERTVDVHVAQLRRKLGDALPLTTVRGVGYRLG